MAVEAFVGNLSYVAGNQTGNIILSSVGMLSNVPGADLVIKLFQVAGALAILYLIFLIMKTLAGWKSLAKLCVIAENVTEINKKMDIFISKYDKESKAKKK